MNIPKLGNFPIKAVFELDQLPQDITSDGSRWLPQLTDANKYWGIGGQKTTAFITDIFNTRKINFNPINAFDELLNPTPNAYFPYSCSASADSSSPYFYDGIMYKLYKGMDKGQGATYLSNEPELTLNMTIPLLEDKTYNTMDRFGQLINIAYKTQIAESNSPLPYSTLSDGSIVPATCLGCSGASTIYFQFDEPIRKINTTPPFIPPFFDIIYPFPQLGVGVAGMYGITLNLRKITWDAENSVYVNEFIDININLYISAKFYFQGWNYLIKNNYFSQNKLIEKKATKGLINSNNLQAVYREVVQTDGNGGFKMAILFGGTGVCAYVEGQDAIIFKEQYHYYTGAVDIESQLNWIAETFNLYPMANGAEIKNVLEGIEMTTRSIEAIDAEPTPENLEINLIEWDSEQDGILQTFSNLFSMSDGAYTVVAGLGVSSNETAFDDRNILFILRNRKGWYNLNLSEIINYDQTINYFAYSNGIIYLGIKGEFPAYPIKYFAVIPNLPYERMPLLTYEFKKLGISFIPCQTHCMAKGGIVSKVY